MHGGRDYHRLLREMLPLIDRLRETEGQDAQAMAEAQPKWDEAWEEIERIQRDYPYSLHTSYITRRQRRLQGYSPDQFD